MPPTITPPITPPPTDAAATSPTDTPAAIHPPICRPPSPGSITHTSLTASRGNTTRALLPGPQSVFGSGSRRHVNDASSADTIRQSSTPACPCLSTSTGTPGASFFTALHRSCRPPAWATPLHVSISIRIAGTTAGTAFARLTIGRLPCITWKASLRAPHLPRTHP